VLFQWLRTNARPRVCTVSARLVASVTARPGPPVLVSSFSWLKERARAKGLFAQAFSGSIWRYKHALFGILREGTAVLVTVHPAQYGANRRFGLREGSPLERDATCLIWLGLALQGHGSGSLWRGSGMGIGLGNKRQCPEL
jgi:hypothetical protein